MSKEKNSESNMSATTCIPSAIPNSVSFITKAMAAKADFVVFFNFGKDTINALKQANNFGLTKKAKILVAWSSGLRDLEEIGPDFCEGVYFGCQFWHDIGVANPKVKQGLDGKIQAVPVLSRSVSIHDNKIVDYGYGKIRKHRSCCRDEST